MLHFSLDGRLFAVEFKLSATTADENPPLLRNVVRRLPAAAGPACALPSPDGRTLRHVEADREVVVERLDDMLRLSVTDYATIFSAASPRTTGCISTARPRASRRFPTSGSA